MLSDFRHRGSGLVTYPPISGAARDVGRFSHTHLHGGGCESSGRRVHAPSLSTPQHGLPAPLLVTSENELLDALERPDVFWMAPYGADR